MVNDLIAPPYKPGNLIGVQFDIGSTALTFTPNTDLPYLSVIIKMDSPSLSLNFLLERKSAESFQNDGH